MNGSTDSDSTVYLLMGKETKSRTKVKKKDIFHVVPYTFVSFLGVRQPLTPPLYVGTGRQIRCLSARCENFTQKIRHWAFKELLIS